MFDDLPVTNPHTNKKKLKAIGAAVAFQAALVASLIVVQMAMPEKLGDFHLLTTLYMAPPPPPPARAMSPAAQPARHVAEKPIAQDVPAVVRQPQPVQEKPLVTPPAIPADIARILESGSAAPPPGMAGGVPGGVRGGISGGVSGGMLGGVLGGTGIADVPPPPPTGPVRVGGNVKEPKLIHIEQPQYPPAARKAHVEGVVMVEATVTADGTVEKVKALSGPPMLMDAATNAVSKWKYQPTFLNGQAVPVILTARITFSLSNSEK